MTMAVVPAGGRAVMSERLDPIDSLDFFPTPPWATRALIEHVIWPDKFQREMNRQRTAWDPAAGEGHMSEVLKEYFAEVIASDVHDYGVGHEIGSFVGEGVDKVVGHDPDWIITNPPFNLAIEFAAEALGLAQRGVALLTRTAWLEGRDRFRRLFDVRPPSTVALFSERVPMVKGRWDPKASTATSYAWIVWQVHKPHLATELVWIPPNRRQDLTKPDDAIRFTKEARLA